MSEEQTEEKLSIKEILEDIKKNQKQLIEEKKMKEVRWPWMRKVGKKKLKEGWTTLIYINENKEVELMKAPISEGTLKIKDKPYSAMADYILSYKGKPCMIIPSWSIEPFSPKKDLADAERFKTINTGYRLIANQMKLDAVKPKKPIPWGIVIGGLAVIGVIYYLISSGGLKGLGI